MAKPLVVIPNYMTHEGDMEILGECVQSIRRTVSDTVDILIVDDCSPQPWLVDVFEEKYERYGFELIRRPENEGFSRTVNVGLSRALAEGREAILMNADIVMLTPGWLGKCRRTAAPTGERAGLVGALLLYPNGLIQHAGLYFSKLANVFEHRFRYAPGNLPEALVKTVCPVTGAFQFIRPEVLEQVGIYDPVFRMGWEDVDFNLRVFQAGFLCVYDPQISAIHHESLFRARPDEKVMRWQDLSLAHLREKWAGVPLAELAPSSEMDAADVLFVAQSVDASCYHRAMLPALTLGCDWCGLDAPPPRMILGRGEVRSAGGEPDLKAYKVVVVQTPAQPGWIDLIAECQAHGTKVIYDTDYDLHAIEQPPGAHALIEELVRLCDGVTCATEHIAARYSRMNAGTLVCENGIDLKAYALTRPPHTTVNIGWAGRTLLPDELRVWLEAVSEVMRAREVTNFVSLGQPFADVLAEMNVVAPERYLSIPSLLPEQYPAAMSIFDLAFDPMGRTPWRRGRSQLRWLEASAWGIPFVGDRRIYPRIEHGRTGFHATDARSLGEAVLRLVDDPQLRADVGGAAREVVEARYSMEAVAHQWLHAFDQVTA